LNAQKQRKSFRNPLEQITCFCFYRLSYRLSSRHHLQAIAKQQETRLAMLRATRRAMLPESVSQREREHRLA
jgi:hypothetical protein